MFVWASTTSRIDISHTRRARIPCVTNWWCGWCGKRTEPPPNLFPQHYFFSLGLFSPFCALDKGCRLITRTIFSSSALPSGPKVHGQRLRFNGASKSPMTSHWGVSRVGTSRPHLLYPGGDVRLSPVSLIHSVTWEEAAWQEEEQQYRYPMPCRIEATRCGFRRNACYRNIYPFLNISGPGDAASGRRMRMRMQNRGVYADLIPSFSKKTQFLDAVISPASGGQKATIYCVNLR